MRFENLNNLDCALVKLWKIKIHRVDTKLKRRQKISKRWTKNNNNNTAITNHLMLNLYYNGNESSDYRNRNDISRKATSSQLICMHLRLGLVFIDMPRHFHTMLCSISSVPFLIADDH